MHTMEDIEALAKTASASHDLLHQRLRDLEHEIAQIKGRRMQGIRNALAAAVEARAQLRAAVADSPELFKRPRSRAAHGVRFGWEKGKGRITWADAEAVVRLIKRHFPEQADVLIKTSEAPVRKALAQLTASELKRVACQVSETDDAPFIRMVDTELEKFVTQLLADEELQGQAA